MQRPIASRTVVLTLAAIAAFAVGGAIGYSVTPGGDIQFEDAVTLGGGVGTSPSGHFLNANNGSLVAGPAATTSGHSAFFGPNLEPYNFTGSTAVENFNQYE